MDIKNVGDQLPQINNSDVRRVTNNQEQKASQSSKRVNGIRSDEVSISSEAVQALEVQRYTRLAKQLPSVREDVVNKVQDRMNSGFYDDPEVANKTALKMFE